MADNIFTKAIAKMSDDTQKESKLTLGKFKKFLGKELKLRQQWERASYVCIMFKEGFHWVNDEGIPDARDPNQLRRHVNKFKSTLRGLKNQITFNDPQVDVIPGNGEKATKDELDLASIIIRSEWDSANNGRGGKQMVKTMVDDAACKTFSMVSVMPNNDPDDPQINDIRTHDSFDVFFDNKDMTKAQMVSISSYEDKNYLKLKGFKNLNNVRDASTPSHSTLKNEFEDMHGKDSDFTRNMVLIDTVYYIQHEPVTPGDESEDADIKADDDPKVMNVVFAGDTVIREPEQLTGYNNLSQLFFLFYLEQDEHIKYPMPWMNDVIPLQRSLNDASENIDTLLHWYAKVRLMQRAGASNTIQLVGDKHGQKIRYSGERPEFMQHPTVPAELFRQKRDRMEDIEDMVGVHASSMGKPSSDRSSGRREAILAAGDSDNVAEPVSNLEMVLSLIFTQVLENASDNVTKVTKFHDDQNEEIAGIGTRAIQTLKDQETATEIKPFKHVKVKIYPGSQMQLAQARNEMFELIAAVQGEELAEQRKALLDVLIRQYNVGLSRDIGKAFERERIENESENADEHIVRLEIEKLARGEIVTATPEQPHQLHIEIKMMALSQIGETEGPIFDTFMENIGQHDAMINPNAQKAEPVQAFTGV